MSCCGLDSVLGGDGDEWEDCEFDGVSQCSKKQAIKAREFAAKNIASRNGKLKWSFAVPRGGKIMLCADCSKIVVNAHLSPLLFGATSKAGKLYLLSE
jgi:hypothetical protein